MKRFVALFAFVMLVAIPAFAAAQTDYPMPNATTEMTPPGGAAVTIVDFAFQPSSVTVPVGATVSWFNAGAAPHTVTSATGAFDSGTIGAGGSFGVTFTTPGTYTYACAIHPMMTGTILVTGT